MDHFTDTDPRLADPKTGFNTDRLLMEVYWEPLQIYYRGSSFHPEAGDAPDVVGGFFAWYAERRYFERWDPTTQRLRYFLLNGLRKYLFEEFRQRKRSGGVEPLPATLSADTTGTTEYDRNYVREIMKKAMTLAEQSCQGEFEQHWKIFCRRTLDRLGHPEIAAEFDLPLERCRTMAKAGRRRLRDVFWELLREQGLSGDRLEEEAKTYLEILES